MSLILITALILSCTAIGSSAATNGIEDKINQILKVYPSGSYFTVSGGSSWYSSSNLADIPSRGGLPAGSVYTAKYGTSTTCMAFANYAFWIIYDYCYYNCPTASSPSYGDYIVMNGGQHRAIYLWEDSSYIYVYDSNGDHQCGVNYNNRYSKSGWYISTVYHAPNYDKLANGVPASITPETTITPGESTSTEYDTGNYTVDCGSDSVLYMRKDHTTSADIVGRLSDGTEIAVTEVYDAGSSAGTITRYWGKVTYGSVTGWVALYYTEFDSVFTAEQELDYSGHSYEKIETVAATAAVCGFTKYKCSGCGKILRVNLTSRTQSGVKVKTDRVVVSGDFVIVHPDMTEEALGDLLPDFSEKNGDKMMITGAVISSEKYDEKYTVIVAGDIDCDGKLTVSDARLTLRGAINLETIGDCAVSAGDWTGDSKITVDDARMSLRAAVNLNSADEIFSLAASSL